MKLAELGGIALVCATTAVVVGQAPAAPRADADRDRLCRGEEPPRVL
jgi:hypothetical protein